jgi:putative membrane protein
MEQEAIKPAELKLSDRLALERTRMAADRTILAWVRTSISFIGFGFTIYKVLDSLVKAQPGAMLIKDQTPRNIGILLILAGVIPMVFVMLDYIRGLKRMGKSGGLYRNPYVIVAGIVILLGVYLLITIVANISFM